MKMVKPEDLNDEELFNWLNEYSKRITEYKNGVYFCEKDNFDPDTMNHRYQLLKNEFHRRVDKVAEYNVFSEVCKTFGEND